MKEEVDYIKSKERFYQTVDLKEVDNPEKLAESILRFRKRTTIVLSYSKYDSEVANAIISRLNTSDFIVYDLLSLLKKEYYVSNGLADPIKEVISDGGYFIPLISNMSIKSSWCMRELQFALKCQKRSGFRRILPIQIEKIDSIPETLISLLNDTDIQDAYSNVINLYEADEWTKRHSLSPNDRIAYNIMDILYWEDMKDEFLVSNESSHLKAMAHFENGRRLFYDDRPYEGIEHAAAMEFMKAAYLGHVGAMVYLAECYQEGWGVVRDTNKTIRLREKASINFKVFVCADSKDYDVKFILWKMADMNISFLYHKDYNNSQLKDEGFVQDAVSKSEIMLFVASNHSTNNKLLIQVLNIAVKMNKRVLVVKMGEVEIPKVLNNIPENDIISYNQNSSGSIRVSLEPLHLSAW